MHIEGQGRYVPQTSTEAETASLIPDDSACHPAPLPSSTSSPSSLKPTGPTFTILCVQGRHNRLSSKFSADPVINTHSTVLLFHYVARKSLRACSEFGSTLKWIFHSNSHRKRRRGLHKRREDLKESGYYIHSCIFPSTAARFTNMGDSFTCSLLPDKRYQGEFKPSLCFSDKAKKLNQFNHYIFIYINPSY